jgi:zinc transport system ATP-binding protein
MTLPTPDSTERLQPQPSQSGDRSENSLSRGIEQPLSSTEIVLAVKNLSVTLEGQEIVRNTSFTVQRGEALAVIGPNGAGKTVLFRALLDLIPYRGEVHWRPGVRIGYVPQKFFVDSSTPITVLEFFLLKSKHFWVPDSEFTDHIRHELTLVGLDESVLSKSLGQLSGGYLQRTLMAWAMVLHPEVLLLDEPTAGIDVGFEETVYNVIHRVQEERGTTILLISHDLSVVYRYAQNVICLNKSVVCHGPPTEALTREALRELYGEAGFYQHETTE